MNGVYWIYGPAAEPTANAPEAPLPLAIVLCPRGGKQLIKELNHLKRSGVQTLVSLLSEDQVDLLDLRDEPQIAARVGIDFVHHPIPDHELPPDVDAFRAFVVDIANRLRAGEKIGFHCWGSIGRAPLTAACTLIQLGWEPQRALNAVEAARGCPVPDTKEQREWVLRYEAVR